jgi:hypothetical protein
MRQVFPFQRGFSMPFDRLRLRAAQRIRDAYITRGVTITEQHLLDQLSRYQNALDDFRPVLRDALSAGRDIRALCVRRYGQHLVHTIRGVVSDVLTTPIGSPATIPDVRTLLEEFDQLDAEFDGFRVDYRGHFLTVTTAPIELEAIYLGPFVITFDWRRLADGAGSRCFDIEALEPNRAAMNEEVIHPHVSHGILCAGDGALPIQRALEQGRLADAFCLVHHILTTYNPHSAHVPLDDWIGSNCDRCGGSISDGDSWSCVQCDREVCADCSRECEHCTHVHCRACLTDCDRCDLFYCDDCSSKHAETCVDPDAVPEGCTALAGTTASVAANIPPGEPYDVPLGSM